MARILLVEDERVSLELTAALLASRGHEVDMAEDGFGALRLARETTYDLAFVDYHLPEMDGYALARLMRSPSESTNSKLKMIAITADRFGLAARREVDTIFDRVLTKPIQPDALFAIVDECFGVGLAETDDLASFLIGPVLADDARPTEPAPEPLRRRDTLPSAQVFPAPTAAERESLQRCFRIAETGPADCLVLLRLAGLPAVETYRAQGDGYLVPLVVLDPRLAALADIAFKIGDGKSWGEAKASLATFAARARGVAAAAAASKSFDARLIAYLFVSTRPLVFCRDETGRLTVPYTAGFSTIAMIESIKRLASRGLIAAHHETLAGKRRRLQIVLTPKGTAFVSESEPGPLRQVG